MAKTRVRAYVESVVLCDEVRHSGNTPGIPDGVHDLIHVRSTLQIPADATFPYCHPVLWLFLRLCGPAGVVSGRVALHREGEAAALWDHRIEGPIELWGFEKSAHHPRCSWTSSSRPPGYTGSGYESARIRSAKCGSR